VLCGSIQEVSESKTHPFAGEQALLALLRERTARSQGAGSAEPSYASAAEGNPDRG
jgi:hypothetical protein